MNKERMSKNERFNFICRILHNFYTHNESKNIDYDKLNNMSDNQLHAFYTEKRKAWNSQMIKDRSLTC